MKNTSSDNNITRFMTGLSYRKALIFSTILLVATLIFSGIGYLIHDSIENLITSDVSRSSLNTALTAAAFIEADVAPYEQLNAVEDYTAGNYDKEYYNRMQKIFRKIKQDTGVDFIYTVKKISDQEMVYILDGEDPKSDLFSPIGSEDILSSYELDVFEGKGSQISGLIHWEGWGDYLSGFSPIMNSEGQVVGIVGVDSSAEAIKALMSNVDMIIILSATLVIGLVTIYAFKIFSERAEAYNVDYLTKLSTRRYHDQQLKYRIDHLNRKGGQLSMMMIDVDNFKAINDQYGHDTGDDMLRHVARIIRRNLRKSDISSRIGGDEFNILLPDTSLEEARRIADRIIKDVIHDNQDLQISVSIGLAEWEKDMDVIDITRLADMSMYRAKEFGRNQVQVVQATS